jgi:hypothetical protein
MDLVTALILLNQDIDVTTSVLTAKVMKKPSRKFRHGISVMNVGKTDKICQKHVGKTDKMLLFCIGKTDKLCLIERLTII